MEERKNCENLHNTIHMWILKNKKIDRTRSKNKKKNITFFKYIDILKIEQFKQAGITLVALVITIIVLLILAGVTISLALGGNGLLSRTIDASLKTKESQEKETIHMAALAAISKNKEIELTATELQEELNEEEAVVYDLNTELKVKMKSNRIYTVDLDGNIKDMSQKNENTKKTLVAQLADSSYGTEENQYQITCIEDLVDFSYKVNGIVAKEDGTLEYTSNRNSFANKYVVLINNLDFKSAASYENFERTDYGDINGNGEVEILLKELTTGKGWIPIGGYGQNGAGRLNGTLNGNNKTINNLYINNEDETSNVGLIGIINSIVIQNLTVKGDIHCNSAYAAGIVGYVEYNGVRTIKNCSFEGNIENIRDNIRTYTSGIIAYESRNINIEKCSSKGIIKGKFNVSGIIGAGKANITECHNESSITGESNDGYSSLGGIIAGGGGSNVTNCYNTGYLQGPRHVGGIVGSSASKIENCYNEGTIKGGGNIGGIAGKIGENQKIIKCYNFGNISGGSNIGGILGYSWISNGIVVERSYNKGTVEGTNYIGGIGGYIGHISSYNSIYNCINEGKIVGNIVSGIVWGTNDNIKVVSCYNIGELEGKTKYGVTYKGNVENCYYLTDRGNSNEKAIEVTSEQLMNYAPILDKAFEIDNENNTITIDEETKQGVWINGEEGKYPQIIMDN